MNIGWWVMNPIAAKSRGSSIGRFGATPGAPLSAMKVEPRPHRACSRRVPPSGRAHRDRPAGAGRFSTTAC